jgi:prenyltransferase beta subunit
VIPLLLSFALAQPAPADPKEAKAAEVKAAVAFLKTHQLPSGGFVTKLPEKGKDPVPSLRTTRTAIRVHRLLGADPPNPDKILEFLLACYDETSGGFADRPGEKPDPISTSVALMILQELKQPTDKYLEKALAFMGEKTSGFEQVRMVASGLEETGKTVPQQKGWVAEIERGRNDDGSFGKGPGRARTTALYVVALQRLGGKVKDADAILKVLRAGQRKDGGFGGDAEGGSDLEACYRVVRLFARLDAKPDRPDDLEKFIAACKNEDGGYAAEPGGPSSLHGTYYAAIIRHWMAGGKKR